MLAPVLTDGELDALFGARRVLSTVGSGGVGKTTLAAALALFGAVRGRRVLCLTIDPAHRLAGALGLESFGAERETVEREYFARYGVEVTGSLTVMMLDAKRTFDELVERHAPSREVKRRIRESRMYDAVSSNLAGVRAYMAMEKVLDVLGDSSYDTVVLDTPPSARALDFFDAPEKLLEVLDSPLTHALVKAVDPTGGLPQRLFAGGLKRGMSALGRVTGAGLIGEIADLLSNLDGLFGGFASRSKEVHERMRSPEFGYVLLTAPSAPQLEDAASLARALEVRGIHIEAMFVNRTAREALGHLRASELASSRSFVETGLPVAVAEACVTAAAESSARRRRQERLLAEIAPLPGVKRYLLPAASSELHRPDALLSLLRSGARLS